MIGAAVIGAGVIQAVLEHQAFEGSITDLSPKEQEAKRVQRQTLFRAQQKQQERAELLEALKPKTIWFYLGLSSK